MASPPPQPPASGDLRHPVPDLQSLQGAYVGNIERLEERAERMSESGSDLQEEIRKTYSELKLVESRRSSLYSIQADALEDRNPPRINTRSRGLSASSHANSIVDLNGNARWGGYSPGGHVTSPVGSLRSGTGSNPPSASIRRQRSGSKASRLGQVLHPEEVQEEEDEFHAGTGSPKSQRSAPLTTQDRGSPPPKEQRKVSSFTRIYDEVANGLPEELRNSVIMGQTPPRNQDRYPEDDDQRYADHHDLPDRPPTAASTDTTHQARTLWQDFDGVHCPDTVQEEPEPSHSGHSRNPSRHSSNMSFMMRSQTDLPPADAPPPEDGMVFYPAPVPKMLNLPKRLSQLPASNLRQKRQSQLLESMQSENRKSMPLPGEYMADSMKPNNRKSRQSLMALPPQLRASAYFDGQTAPTQEFAVKGESAEHTLESILDASARAPVSAFTDHPFTGQVGNEVYGPEHKRNTSKLPEVPPTLQETRRRSSFNILDTKHNSSGDKLKKLKKRNSSSNMNLLLVKANESRMSLGAELDERDENARGPSAEHGPGRSSFEENHGHHPDGIQEDEELEEDGEPEEPQYGAPTTLLAELQLRKAKQKTRNMNYVTLMEQGQIDGRHTLLQLNDLAEIEKQKRLRKKVNLAWEAPVEDDDSDDDVPLGVLYKQQPGPSQYATRQPSMGLLAQRELEDTEPLSSRRNRLQGGNPNQRRTQYLGSHSQVNLTVPTTTLEPSSDEDEGETLAERMRRLKEKQTHENALGGDDLHKRTISGDFASEMMSRIGAPEDEQKPAPVVHDAEDEEEEETLGQRRARLQAEAAAQPQQLNAPPTSRPNLRSTSSLADILASNPIDPSTHARKITNEKLVSHLPEGSLLHKSVMDEEKRKQQRLNATMRASSYGTDPLLKGVSREKDDDDVPLGLKLNAYRQGANPMVGSGQQGMMGGGMQMPMQNPHMMGMQNPQMMGMQQPMMGGMHNPQMMQMGMQNPAMMRQSMMMPPMNGMPMQMPMGMNGMPMQMNMGMGMPMGMGMGMMQGPPMDPRQRDTIDRWMQGIGN